MRAGSGDKQATHEDATRQSHVIMEEWNHGQRRLYCWCGARKVRHVVRGHPTAVYECPNHFFANHQPNSSGEQPSG